MLFNFAQGFPALPVRKRTDTLAPVTHHHSASPATSVARPEAGKDTSVTKPTAPSRPLRSLLSWGLTVGAVVAGPPLLAAAQAAPALTLASVAFGLTALVIGLALWQRKHPVRVAAPARRRIQTLGWSPP